MSQYKGEQIVKEKLLNVQIFDSCIWKRSIVCSIVRVCVFYNKESLIIILFVKNETKQKMLGKEVGLKEEYIKE